MRGTDRSSNTSIAAAVFAVIAVVVVFAAGLGPINVVEPGWLDTTDSEGVPDTEPMPAPTRPFLTETPAAWQTDDDAEPGDFPWQAALVALLVAAAVLAYVFLRRLPASVRRLGRRSVVGGSVDEWPDAADDLRAGARTAAELLSGPGSTGARAVVEAWLALESAAADSGAPRDPAQTPSEFTAALLRRHHADEAATSTLLGLYHRARFSPDPAIGADDVAAARSALDTILRTVTTHSAPAEGTS